MDHAVARILDANLNRTAEALRVLEDHARFALNDAHTTAAAKSIRHRLVELARPLAEIVVRARDAGRDVGRTNELRQEYERQDGAAVAVAAAKRAEQSLRTLEEYAKTFDAMLAGRFEHLRYETYDLEHAVSIRHTARARLADMSFYVIITESICHERRWLETARAAIDGGADAIQLREKSLPDAELLARAVKLADLCRTRGVLFFVNDRPDIAALARANLHVGQDDLPVSEARRVLPLDALVGLSTHTPAQIEQAFSQSPDYIAVGPMFTTQTKPQPTVAGPDLIRPFADRTALPIVAIGGITPDNVHEPLLAGAQAACVCSAVAAERDPKAAAAELAARIKRAKTTRPSLAESDLPRRDVVESLSARSETSDGEVPHAP